VLTCLTPEFVTVVADRRITRGEKMLEDFATKLVVVCDRGVVGYSGLARLPGPDNGSLLSVPTDEWIVSVLATHHVTNLSEAAKILQEEAASLFANAVELNKLTRRSRRIAFFVAGWSLNADGFVPVVSVVSNALDHDWNWLAEAVESFDLRVIFGSNPRKFSLVSIGASVPTRIVLDIKRTLRRGFRRGIGPSSVFRVSVRAMRSVASANTTVSKHLLAVCVPPPVPERQSHFALAGSPMASAIAFIDFKDPMEFGRFMGPHFVCGRSGMTNVDVGSL
jgi:hypothetical protein